jgi:hypothetical protein
LTSNIKGGTQTKSLREQGAEENIWTEERSNRKYEELHNFHTSTNIIRMTKPRSMSWTGYVARMGEKRNEYRTLVGNPEGERPLLRPKHWWMDDSKIDIRDMG